MALSGLAIIGFVVAHLFGTLKIFLGPDETNEYGEAIRGLGGDFVPHGHLLWVMRIGLTAAFAVHLHSAFSLDRRNRRANSGVRYQHQRFTAASYASRTMLWSGIIVGLFILFHIVDLTLGATNNDFVSGDPYANQVASFSNPAISGVYLLALVALVAHLQHGIESLVRSLGLRASWWTDGLSRRVSMGISTMIGLGYATVPIAVLTGIVS